ncbi:50S ribosomal protein L18 [Candidatus Kaiserbacteria bacterium]|nr:50S ribosomal protein L18 [Candidatus Kaiserbacteria bacterium]
MKTSTTSKKIQTRSRRHARIRARVKGTAQKPRLAVFKSNKAVYAQLIDDDAQTTLASADSRVSKAKTLLERGTDVGKTMAEKAGQLKIDTVVFDRGGFTYIGIVKAVAEGARAGGLKF